MRQASSGQKLLFAPEYSTIRMMDELGEVAMQRLRSTNIKYAVPTPEDWHLVRKHEVAFEQQLVYSLEMWEFMRWFRRTHMVRTHRSFFHILYSSPPSFALISYLMLTFPAQEHARPLHEECSSTTSLSTCPITPPSHPHKSTTKSISSSSSHPSRPTSFGTVISAAPIISTNPSN